MSEHTAAMPVLVQCLEGHLKVTGGGSTVDFVPGGILHFPTRHDLARFVLNSDGTVSLAHNKGGLSARSIRRLQFFLTSNYGRLAHVLRRWLSF